jgi:hypothetical protein
MSFTEFLNENRLLEELGDFPERALKIGRKHKFLVIEYNENEEGLKLTSNRGSLLTSHNHGRFLHADLLCHYLEGHNYLVKLKEIK